MTVFTLPLDFKYKFFTGLTKYFTLDDWEDGFLLPHPDHVVHGRENGEEVEDLMMM
jgi:hypothetical protein